jgi:hypothetical protein
VFRQRQRDVRAQFRRELASAPSEDRQDHQAELIEGTEGPERLDGLRPADQVHVSAFVLGAQPLQQAFRVITNHDVPARSYWEL